MTVGKCEKSGFKQRVIYVCLLALAFSFEQPAPLYASCGCECDEQEVQYNRAAVAVAGITVVGLIVGVGCLAFGTRHKNHLSSHHHHYSSDYSYSYSDYTNYSYDSDYYSSDYSRSSDYSSDYSDYPFSDESVFPTTRNTLSGIFTLNDNLNLLGEGSVTPIIELPDGTVNLLDPLFFSNSGSSTPFGPFNQKGKYRFSIRVEPGTTLSSKADVCMVQVNVNGVTDEVIKLELPASPQANFSPSPVSFRLR